jgi:peptidoglycan/LPS O-acetylase OafA/YrhL
MFGIYRTGLALMVMVHHLAYVPIIGHLAVHGFFILSGYLMTLILNKNYGYSLHGVSHYLINRFLRLFPMYWLILLITCIILLIYGSDQAAVFRSHMFFPTNSIDWLQNISLIYFDPFPGAVSPRLSPPTWALTIELFFYALIGMGLSRNKKITVIWFVLSLCYFIWSHYVGKPYSYRYSFILAGSLGFSLGSLIYHYKQLLITTFFAKTDVYTLLLLTSLLLLNWSGAAVAHLVDAKKAIFYTFFYLNYVFNGLLILALIGYIPNKTMKKIDSILGDYSYPIYLIHWPIGFLCAMLFFREPIVGAGLSTAINTIISIFFVFIISFFCIRIVDRPISKIRDQLRGPTIEKS